MSEKTKKGSKEKITKKSIFKKEKDKEKILLEEDYEKIKSSSEDDDKKESLKFKLRGINLLKIDNLYLQKEKEVEPLSSKFSKMAFTKLGFISDDKFTDKNMIKSNIYYLMRDGRGWLPSIPEKGLRCRNCGDEIKERILGCPYKFNKIEMIVANKREEENKGKVDSFEDFDIRRYTVNDYRKKNISEKIVTEIMSSIEGDFKELTKKELIESKGKVRSITWEYFDTLFYFCRVPCILRFLKDRPDKRFVNSVSLLRCMIKKLGMNVKLSGGSTFGIINKIGCAPPIDWLFCNGGKMSFDQYHKAGERSEDSPCIIFSENTIAIRNRPNSESKEHFIGMEKELRKWREEIFKIEETKRVKKKIEDIKNSKEIDWKTFDTENEEMEREGKKKLMRHSSLLATQREL